ncbi:MAG: universal stress protein [Promethearchaeota archaeon]
MTQPQIFQRVCIATDGSDESMKAANLAINIAKMNQAEVYVIYVIDDKVVEKILSMSRKTAEEVREEYSHSGNSILQFIKNLAKKAGLKAEVQLDEGYPSEKITGYVRKIRADLLVIGHQIKKKSRIVALGSRTVRMIELTDCPILIVK